MHASSVTSSIAHACSSSSFHLSKTPHTFYSFPLRVPTTPVPFSRLSASAYTRMTHGSGPVVAPLLNRIQVPGWDLTQFDAWRSLPRDHAQYRCLLVEGQPGCGKSTALAVLHVHAAFHAIHLCSVQDARRGDALLMLQSLAYQVGDTVSLRHFFPAGLLLAGTMLTSRSVRRSTPWFASYEPVTSSHQMVALHRHSAKGACIARCMTGTVL